MNRRKILLQRIIAITIVSGLVFSALADENPELVGKDLDQNRDLVHSVMQGRNYVVETDSDGRIKQIVDAGANGNGTEAPEGNDNGGTGTVTAVAANTVLNTPSIELPEHYQGQAAIGHLGADLPKIAADYGLTPEKLEDILLTDQTVHIDSNNRIFYIDNTAEHEAGVEAGIEAAETSTTDNSIPIASTATLANAFKLHSKPGASKTIYLDFDGHTATGTAWSSSTIVAPAFDLSGNPAVFDNTELSNIISVWNRVSEDYIPFDVDVTTEQPSADALSRTNIYDTYYGTRVVITKSGTISCTCGGIAYVGVVSMVNNTAYQPAWVFQQSLANNEKYIAEAASHEAGHTLGLFHDGQKTGTSVNAYYSGHGSGATGWAPIMGASYYKNVTQWSNGVYPNANNQQNDFAVLASNGIYPRNDAVGNTMATASLLTDNETGATVSIKKFGVIETSTDIDMYAVNAAGGAVNISVSPATTGANLDTQLTLYKADGTVLASSAPETVLSASINVTVPAGTHFLAVTGSAHAPSGTDYGYPTYGSLGQYQITASFSTSTITIPAMAAAVNPTPTIMPSPPSTPKVYAGSVKLNVKKSNKVNARVAIKVVNNQGYAIPNAIVRGVWSGAFTGRLNGKTTKSGIIMDTPNAASARKGASGTFKIQGITAPGYIYDPALNDKTVATITW